MKSILHGLAIALPAAAAAAAGPAAAEPPRVVATIAPIHSLVAGVMEGVAEPELLLAGSVSPHHFQLRPSQARMLDRADAIVWVGPGLETALVRSLEALGDARVLALMSIDGVMLLPSRPDGAHGGAHAAAPADPHDDHDEHGHAEDGHAEDERAEDGHE
jgi:zinc transport system substrate-binding protein